MIRKKMKALRLASLFLLILLLLPSLGETVTPPPMEDGESVVLRGLVLEVETWNRMKRRRILSS